MAIERWPTPHSSNVTEVAWDREKEEMTVTFKGGGSYVVSGASSMTASDMANDPSPGAYFHRHIKGRMGVRKL